jgi:hypothetical protein
MNKILTLTLALSLIACAKQPAADTEASTAPTAPTPGPTVTPTPSPSPTPTPPPTTDIMAYTAKSPAYLNSNGSTLLALTGNFKFPTGTDSQGRTVTSVSVVSASGKVCAITSSGPHTITCYLPSYKDGSNTLIDADETLTISRTLSDLSTQQVTTETISSRVQAQFTFTDTADLAPHIPFSVNAGSAAGVTNGWWIYNPFITMTTPYVHFQLKNTSVVAAAYKLNYNISRAIFQPDASDCGTVNGAYNEGTLQPGESCTMAFKMTAPVGTAQPPGTVYSSDDLWLRYDDRLGTVITHTQAVKFLYSN